jgi:uncharacterized protein YndB with AHSA1/START domain
VVNAQIGARAVVQIRRTLPAPAEEAFRAWTDPARFAQWFKPPGGHNGGVEMDVRVGGRYRCTMRLPGYTFYAVGEFVEIDPPKRLVFTFGWEHAIVRLRDSLITIEFEDRGDETEIVVTHARLGGRTMRALHDWGWRWLLRNIAHQMRQGRLTR